jgi:hypothetical protein
MATLAKSPAEHTPGPWGVEISRQFSNNGSFHLYLTDSTGRKIAALWGRQEEKEANSLLISVAPELLETLLAVLPALEQGFSDCGEDPDCIWAEPLAATRAAIAKATGAA